jgi:hypothetical protein
VSYKIETQELDSCGGAALYVSKYVHSVDVDTAIVAERDRAS